MFGGRAYGGGGYGGNDVADIVSTDTQTHLSVQVAFTTGALETPVWEDITSDVREWSVSRGRRRELERFEAGSATVVLGNLERQYDSVYADGPHFGNLRPGRRIRILETFNSVTYPVFYGFIDRWHLDYPGVGHDATATVTATDAFKLLARAELPRSVYEHEVEADAPELWWRFDEDLARFTEGVVLNSGSLGVTADGAFVNAPRVGGQGLVVNHPGSSMETLSSTVVAGTPYNGAMISDSDYDLTATVPFTVECWARETDDTASQGVIWSYVDPGNTEVSGVLARINGGVWTDQYIFLMFNAALDTYYGVETASGFATGDVGAIHHFVCSVAASGQMSMWIDGVAQTTAATSGGGSIHPLPLNTGRLFNVAHNPRTAASSNVNWMGEVDELAVYREVLSAERIAAHYAAGTHPWQDDLPGARITRILDLVGFPADLREIDVGLTTLQSATLRNS